ncbi:MBL fold metallo-hydrolase [Edaphobacter bradus]|uniref:MBL fold metallo-hydrolase n=1 Tax=Edaphobacter bradus TaxID=2259016 RepID=UPI0021E0E4CE|nr:MBL fold metallo-hydrolase [Edaphobacter bradus]
MITRRRFLATSATAATAAWLAPRNLFAQQDVQEPEMVVHGRAAAATAKITTQKLQGNVSVLLGSGGNIAVLPGPEGKLLVDAGISTSKPQITEALAAISPDPIQHLVNTHWHWDHTDGNLWMHAAGATIIAHERTRRRLSSPQVIAAFNATFPALPADALPTKIFTDTDTLTTNGATLLLSHYDPAHTDTDISVLFTDADVLHTGDTWFNGVYPFIDYSTGGHIDGMIRATQRNLATGTGSTIVIPGHGPVGDKDQLSQSLDMLTAIRDKVAALKKQGKTVDEAVAAKPTAQFDEKWGKGFVQPEMFVKLVYQGV